MKPGNDSCQTPSPYSTSYSDDSITLGHYFFSAQSDSSPSPSSSSSLATPEPECDDQMTRNKIIQHLVLKPKPKKRYQCSQCLKSFTRPSALQTHNYTHTAEKPFQCQIANCGRSFSVVSNLRRHFKVHQKVAVGDKLSAKDRLRCVRDLMERSSRILATQNQIPPNTLSPSSSCLQQQKPRTQPCSLPALPQQQPLNPYRPILPDLIPASSSSPQSISQSASSHLGFSNPVLGSNLPVYWYNQLDILSTITINNSSSSYGDNHAFI